MIPESDDGYTDFCNRILGLPFARIEAFIRDPFTELTTRSTKKYYYDDVNDFDSVKTDEGCIQYSFFNEEKFPMPEKDATIRSKASALSYLRKYKNVLQ
jgi:hypothetical protein